jgi:uncharacterized membrane protein required for colicin V production
VNWFDFVLLGIVVVGAFMGMRIGIIGAAFTAAGVLVGWLLAGQYSDDIGALAGDSVSNDTIVTVLSYVVIIIAAVVVSRIAAKIVKPLLTVFTLGLSSLVDRLGGVALGLLLGVAVSGALILAAARITYDFELSTITDVAVLQQVTDRVVQVEGQLAKVEGAKEGLETALSESQIVGAFINVADAIPADTLGFVPADFKVALKILATVDSLKTNLE